MFPRATGSSLFYDTSGLRQKFLKRFFRNFRVDWTAEEVDFAIEHAQVYEGEEALRHVYRVASSWIH